MGQIKQLIHKAFAGRSLSSRLADMPVSEVFKTIYDQNTWKGKESISGTGSSLQQTAHITAKLPAIMNELNVSSLLDIPCGDFYWMRHVDFAAMTYIGADIVEDLIRQNKEHETDKKSFIHRDVMTGELPAVDVIFCRDCLVHFSEQHVWRALQNIARCNAKFLITTTFTHRTNAKKIETGQWRPLNLQAAPFALPKPIQLIDEKCTQDDGAYPDKMLGIWTLESIRSAVNQPKAAA